jgi:excisionase family DNA binding protein
MARKFLTVKDVAEMLSISVQTAYKWARCGRLPAVKLGYLLRFDPDAIERLIERSKKVS